MMMDSLTLIILAYEGSTIHLLDPKTLSADDKCGVSVLPKVSAKILKPTSLSTGRSHLLAGTALSSHSLSSDWLVSPPMLHVGFVESLCRTIHTFAEELNTENTVPQGLQTALLRF